MSNRDIFGRYLVRNLIGKLTKLSEAFTVFLGSSAIH
jgi:hypothetical protein